MAKLCSECGGNGVCTNCGGSGSSKKQIPHPSGGLTDKNTGAVRCLVCNGKLQCIQCKGSGRE
jgi:hypothetical protein